MFTPLFICHLFTILFLNYLGLFGLNHLGLEYSLLHHFPLPIWYKTSDIKRDEIWSSIFDTTLLLDRPMPTVFFAQIVACSKADQMWAPCVRRALTFTHETRGKQRQEEQRKWKVTSDTSDRSVYPSLSRRAPAVRIIVVSWIRPIRSSHWFWRHFQPSQIIWSKPWLWLSG